MFLLLATGSFLGLLNYLSVKHTKTTGVDVAALPTGSSGYIKDLHRYPINYDNDPNMFTTTRVLEPNEQDLDALNGPDVDRLDPYLVPLNHTGKMKPKIILSNPWNTLRF